MKPQDPLLLETQKPRAVDAASVLGPVARSSVVDAIADRLRGEILAGRLEAGARLPSERELALALGVNRLTLRAALARLEALGLVVTKHGAGTLVASWRERAGLETLAALAGVLSPLDEAWHEMLADVLEVRRVLAAEVVALAALRHSPEDVVVMKDLAAQQSARVHDSLAIARGDLAFMRAVVRAAKNVGLELVLNTFARFPDEHPSLVAALYENPSWSLDSYPLVVSLIEQGDADAARNVMRHALELVDRTVTARARERAGLAPKHEPAPAKLHARPPAHHVKADKTKSKKPSKRGER